MDDGSIDRVMDAGQDERTGRARLVGSGDIGLKPVADGENLRGVHPKRSRGHLIHRGMRLADHDRLNADRDPDCSDESTIARSLSSFGGQGGVIIGGDPASAGFDRVGRFAEVTRRDLRPVALQDHLDRYTGGMFPRTHGA